MREVWGEPYALTFWTAVQLDVEGSIEEWRRMREAVNEGYITAAAQHAPQALRELGDLVDAVAQGPSSEIAHRRRMAEAELLAAEIRAAEGKGGAWAPVPDLRLVT